jgi:RHS repeat-associated protein
VNALIEEELVTGGQSFALAYGFDAQDRLTSVSYPGGTVVPITPNAYGEPESVGSYATSIDYWPNGSIEELQYGTQQGSGRKYTTTQNPRQLPENLKVVLGATTLANLTHSYDANTNVTFIDDAVHGPSYGRSMGYDDVDRLKTASGFWGSGSYSYDALGNIKSKVEGSTYYYYSYDGNNRLYYVYGPGTGLVSYDARGNVTSHRGHSYTYNLAGNMVSSTNPSVTYMYDGHKRRVQKTEGGQTSYTVYGQNGKLMHKRKGGVSTNYVYAGSLLIAKKEGSTVHYLHTDLLGSPIKGDNGPAYTEHYRPWGEKKDHPLQLADDVGYTGHQDDVATGLTYMQARYYDPIIGRFMAVDPVRFDGIRPQYFGRFHYAFNNPINVTDPDGRAANFLGQCVANAACRTTSSGAIGFGIGYGVNALMQWATTGEIDKVQALAAGASAGAVSAAVAYDPTRATNPKQLAAIGAAAGAAAQVATDGIKGQEQNPLKIAINAAANAISVPGATKGFDLIENLVGAKPNSIIGELVGASLAEGANLALSGSIEAVTSIPVVPNGGSISLPYPDPPKPEDYLRLD